MLSQMAEHNQFVRSYLNCVMPCIAFWVSLIGTGDVFEFTITVVEETVNGIDSVEEDRMIGDAGKGTVPSPLSVQLSALFCKLLKPF